MQEAAHQWRKAGAVSEATLHADFAGAPNLAPPPRNLPAVATVVFGSPCMQLEVPCVPLSRLSDHTLASISVWDLLLQTLLSIDICLSGENVILEKFECGQSNNQNRRATLSRPCLIRHTARCECTHVAPLARRSLAECLQA